MTTTVDTLNLTIDGTAVDCRDTLTGVALTFGGAFGTGTPDPATCQVSVVVPLDYVIPDAGAPIGITVTLSDGRTVPRFTGTVWSRAIDWRAGLDRPILSVLAVGALSHLGRIFVGDVPWPAEDDGARAARIFGAAAAQWPELVYRIDPGSLNVRPRDVDRQPASFLLAQLAESTLATLTDTPNGTVEYVDRDSILNVPAFATLDACEVLAPFALTSSVDDLVNEAKVTYGAPTVPGDDSTRPQVVVTAPDSIARWKVFAADFITELATVDDATDFGNAVLDSASAPTLSIGTAAVDAESLADPGGFLAGLEVAAVLNLTGLPLPGPAGASLFVEGYVETWRGPDQFRVDLTLVDVRARGLGTRWLDVPCVTWEDVPPELTWREANTWAPCPPSSGRWADTPANLNWAAAGDTPWEDWT